MRTKIAHPKSGLLRYGIREMVELSQKLEQLDPDFRFIGENIGDPVAKGWIPPVFLREIIRELINQPDGQVFAYSHSRGNPAARRWIAELSRQLSPTSRLDAEHILFTNGLGGAISVLYRMLAPGARIIQPNPGYPAHISSERFAAGAESIGYRLDPARGWQPDLGHLEEQIRRHPDVAGILLINPNNPTGTLYDAEVLESVLKLAERHHLMIISDEVYFRMVFNNNSYTHITQLAAERVPLVVMRGVSKDVPWPGARCGWLEFHNTGLDNDFMAFFDNLKRQLMLEVCATTLPQAAVPLIYMHPQYAAWLAACNADLEKSSNAIFEILAGVPGLQVNRIQAAFYMMPVFEPGTLNDRQTLPIANTDARRYIEKLTSMPDIPLDRRFAYYLLGATGICVVPASDFESPFPGFRVTTLDRDPVRRAKTYQTLAHALRQYMASA